MTDNEIIKFMQCVMGNDANCSECEYQKVLPFPSCRMMCAKNALDLINRQKNKIERLKNENIILSINADTAFQDGLNEAKDLYAEQVKDEIKSEAIKEFAERLKSKIWHSPECNYINSITPDYIDNLVKEMTEVETNQRKEDGKNGMPELQTRNERQILLVLWLG